MTCIMECYSVTERTEVDVYVVQSMSDKKLNCQISAGRVLSHGCKKKNASYTFLYV